MTKLRLKHKEPHRGIEPWCRLFDLIALTSLGLGRIADGCLPLSGGLASSDSSMNYIAGSDRTEALLLPEVLDDYIAPENPVRFIDAFVGQLDLGKAGFTNAQLQERGRPPYDPGDLLRLYLYGYLNRVRSSRGLEREAARNASHRRGARQQSRSFAPGNQGLRPSPNSNRLC